MAEGHDQGASVRITPRRRSATGVEAITSSLSKNLAEIGLTDTVKALSVLNQTNGYDCPGCAWPERKHRHVVEFCESGAKAVADEADHSRCDAAFFARHSVADLAGQDDFWLGQRGRLTEPMWLAPGDTHYRPIPWDTANALISETLRGLTSPDEAIFYTSGRTSNEAAFTYQLMARAFGTNNLPDCSNMCHEPTSVALQEAIGIGKGSVTFEDFDATDLVLVVGQNPGTNHPRMLTTLEEVKRRGAHIVAVNPLPEAGLLRFKNPQRVRGLLGKGTSLADLHLAVRLGGDQALFRWLTRRAIDEGRMDEAFVQQHTDGFAALVAGLSQDPDDLAAEIGVPSEQLEQLWTLVRSSPRIIVCWAMGITQHRDAVATIRDMVNFVLVTGNIGRPGAGLSPIRGHSNVQGDRTMGVWDKPTDAFLDAVQERFGFDPPRHHGFDAVKSQRAMLAGKASVIVSLGGNLARSLPDTAQAEEALRGCRLTVHISTKLNRSHLVPGATSILLPTLGRTDIDRQSGGDQFVTVEDSFGTVHRSAGMLQPPTSVVRSEVAILTALAELLVPDCGVPWADYRADYALIRADIAAVVPGFEAFEERVREPGGFLLSHPPRDRREFHTPSGRAQLSVETRHAPYHQANGLILQSIRSHDQFNTTIYGLKDRYRGISGGRRVLFANVEDIAALGYKPGDIVDMVNNQGGRRRVAEGFRLVAYDTPRNCAAAYYPETNVLIDIDDVSAESGTPSYKSVPILLEPSRTQ